MRMAWTLAAASALVGCGNDEALLSVGCGEASLAVSPSAPGARGPAVVGARTVDLVGLSAEIWYPAAGAGEGPPKRYDLREVLPAGEEDKIADADNPYQVCDCWSDLPIDASHGPYPIIVFMHGFGGYRAQSLELVTHWASRGYVVVAAEHPGLYLGDALAPACGMESVAPDPEGDVRAMLSALASPSGEVAFLAGLLDASRLAVIGHSAGGRALRDLGDVASLLIPMGAQWDGPPLHPSPTLVLGAFEDRVVTYDKQVGQYELASPPKHLVGIAGTGHLAFSSLCSLENEAGEDLVTVGESAGICGFALAGALFDCDPSYLPDARAWEIIQDATSSLLDAELQCHPAVDPIAAIGQRHPEVGDYRESL
jgi:fermentation-respiration switch protein FrsA (DUF1100 family)